MRNGVARVWADGKYRLYLQVKSLTNFPFASAGMIIGHVLFYYLVLFIQLILAYLKSIAYLLYVLVHIICSNMSLNCYRPVG